MFIPTTKLLQQLKRSLILTITESIAEALDHTVVRLFPTLKEVIEALTPDELCNRNKINKIYYHISK